jgi:hypothetical protein
MTIMNNNHGFLRYFKAMQTHNYELEFDQIMVCP